MHIINSSETLQTNPKIQISYANKRQKYHLMQSWNKPILEFFYLEQIQRRIFYQPHPNMRFQNLENSKIYRLYRDDQTERLKRKIEQIKKRKNQHFGSKQSHLLPYISAGFGFSLERKHQIEKENKRLQQKISKAKNTHSNYFFNKIEIKKSASSKNHHTSRIVQTFSNRSGERSLILPEARTERTPLRPLKLLTKTNSENTKQKTQEHQTQETQPHSFRKQIMRIYNESFSNFKKLPF